MPYIQACSGAVWQRKVDVARRRVFAIRRLLAWFSTPIVFLAAGPFADHLFEPAMSEGTGVIAAVLGPLVGIAKGKGYGAMFLVSGAIGMVLVILIFQLPGLKFLDEEVPDIEVDA